MLDFKLLTFRTLAEVKSYTKTAEVLHITQPAVSQHIKKLEEYYAQPLVCTQGKQFSLTQAGQLLYDYILSAQRSADLLLAKINRQRLELKIGATLSIVDYFLPALLADYCAKQPQNASICVGNTQTLLQNLQQGSLDVAFIEGVFDRNQFYSAIFAKSEFVAVAAVNHPLAEKTVALEDLYQYLLVHREEGSGTRRILENYLERSNSSIYSFCAHLEVGSMVFIKKLVETTQGITFLYKQAAAEELLQKRLTVLHLKGFPLVRPLFFVYRKNSLYEQEYQEFYQLLFGVGIEPTY